MRTIVTMRFIRPARPFRLLPGVVLLSALLFAACSDEHETGHRAGASIGFAVTALQGAGDAPATTRASADSVPHLEITPIGGETSDGGQELYLHTLTEEGIATDGAREAGATTKAAPVTTATMHADATVFAAVYPSTDTWNNTVAPSYFFDTQVKKTESWTTAYYWPGTNKRVAFFAYAPHHCAGVTLTTGIGTPGAPSFSYTVPAAVADQTDLLTASSVDVAGVLHTPAPLAFRHALTAVRFETGTDLLPGTVTKITLKGVYGTATHRIGESTWSGHAGTKDFAQTLAVVTPDPNVAGTEITQPSATFMMIPQTLPANAKIEVVYTDKLTNTQRTLTASIAGKAWPMGKTVTYRISTNSIVVTPMLTVTPPADFEYTGGTKGYTVASYLQVTRPGDPTKTLPMPWTVEYSTDNGGSWSSTKPAWLTTFTESGAGGTSATPCTATVTAQTGVTGYPHNAALLAATPVNDGTNANIYDLSTKGGTAVMRTANCYIVNAAGRYKLPLVYGNAVDYVKVPGTGNNSSAYTSTASGGNVLNPFINHRGAGITDPYIYNNTNCIPANCTLVWQDEPNLVTNVNLSSDGHFLEFTVNQSTIRQGNAVVAVRNASNTVLWSWHIWVTDYKPGTTGTTPDKEITNYQGIQYKIMPVNLGWCDGEEKNYAERTVQVRFKQTGTSATQTITVKQKAHAITELGNNTYFQWGRKDPFVGALAGNINKTWYDANGNVKTNQLPPISSFSTGNACITSGITLPNTFCTNGGYMDNKYANLWSANNTVYTGNDNPVVKTIYDPCPVGYKMPPSNAFTGFTTTGNSTSTQSQFNVQGTWSNGWNFHCGPNHTGDTVFFPASGGRIYSSAVPYVVGSGAFYLTAGPGSTYYGRFLLFSPGLVHPLYNDTRCYGFGVRAAQEE
ncbi:fimbrillin family protein [Bacteroides heparinolyticus]|uniref:Fimbrillin family protein n=1 Tax=Prevotella heparinolytica TaxID=28113 RepID=A0A3P2A790_9BACE|nr:fimbrillin family protein [Bacteroides heparinolyticus]RRD90855.1 fimbrillin family protein [Bacteroides heparinolyticus]